MADTKTPARRMLIRWWNFIERFLAWNGCICPRCQVWRAEQAAKKARRSVDRKER